MRIRMTAATKLRPFPGSQRMTLSHLKAVAGQSLSKKTSIDLSAGHSESTNESVLLDDVYRLRL